LRLALFEDGERVLDTGHGVCQLQRTIIELEYARWFLDLEHTTTKEPHQLRVNNNRVSRRRTTGSMTISLEAYVFARVLQHQTGLDNDKHRFPLGDPRTLLLEPTRPSSIFPHGCWWCGGVSIGAGAALELVQGLGFLRRMRHAVLAAIDLVGLVHSLAGQCRCQASKVLWMALVVKQTSQQQRERVRVSV
jgi:hypothetical protein